MLEKSKISSLNTQTFALQNLQGMWTPTCPDLSCPSFDPALSRATCISRNLSCALPCSGQGTGQGKFCPALWTPLICTIFKFLSDVYHIQNTSLTIKECRYENQNLLENQFFLHKDLTFEKRHVRGFCLALKTLSNEMFPKTNGRKMTKLYTKYQIDDFSSKSCSSLSSNVSNFIIISR